MHGAGHGEDAGRVPKSVVEAVLGELAADGIAGASHAVSVGAAALNHEAGDDPVEIKAVVEALLYKADEIVHRVGRDLGIKLRLDDVAVFHFKCNYWICHIHSPFSCAGHRA